MGVQQCFDLKGSLFGRITEFEDDDSFASDTGFMVLKDQNFIKKEKNGLNIKEERKKEIFEMMKKDTEMLLKNGLMDYSLFLV